MWLIHTSTLQLQNFVGSPPPYAILSHTWGQDEISLQELISGKTNLKAGYRKLQNFCRRAAQDGWEYGWMDTCCIDKTSSAELSEAINSMFAWYSRAGVCFVHLDDVRDLHEPKQNRPGSLSQAKWFTRGWTLQELLAPSYVLFLNKDWKNLGTKRDLKDLIQWITSIRDLDNYNSASLAQKFSWASRRSTTREEDRAYSLLGLVGVNMPLIYGEGDRAFERLQKELLSQTDDDSIFAWNPRSLVFKHSDVSDEHIPPDETAHATSMLARSLNRFSKCTRVERIKSTDMHRNVQWSMTNRGLSATFRGYVKKSRQTKSLKIGIILNCSFDGQTKPSKRLVVELSSYDQFNVMRKDEGSIKCLRTRTPIHRLEKETQGRENDQFFDVLIGRSEETILSHDMCAIEPQRLNFSTTSVDSNLEVHPRYCAWTSGWNNTQTPSLAMRVSNSAGLQQIYKVQISEDELSTRASRSCDGDVHSTSRYKENPEDFEAVRLKPTETEPHNCLKPECWIPRTTLNKRYTVHDRSYRLLYIGCDLVGVGHFVVIVGGRNPFVNLRRPSSPCVQTLSTPEIDVFGGLDARFPWTQVKQIYDAYEAYCGSLDESTARSYALLDIGSGRWLSASMELKNDSLLGSYYDIVFKTWTKKPHGYYD